MLWPPLQLLIIYFCCHFHEGSVTCVSVTGCMFHVWVYTKEEVFTPGGKRLLINALVYNVLQWIRTEIKLNLWVCVTKMTSALALQRAVQCLISLGVSCRWKWISGRIKKPNLHFLWHPCCLLSAKGWHSQTWTKFDKAGGKFCVFCSVIFPLPLTFIEAFWLSLGVSSSFLPAGWHLGCPTCCMQGCICQQKGSRATFEFILLLGCTLQSLHCFRVFGKG